MKNKFYYIISILTVFVFLIVMSSCSNNSNNYENYATVIYHLEGGSYAGSKQDVKIYYDVKEGETLSIGSTLDKFTTHNFEADGTNLKLSGWYSTKNENGTYENKVDGTYKLSYKQELNLYAKWSTAATYKFVIMAKINNEDVEVTSFDANEAEELVIDNQRRNRIKEAILDKGYTYMNSFTYDNKTILDTNAGTIVMPGSTGDKDEVKCKVYANIIKGKYQLVSTDTELINAINEGFSDYDGIYLLNDIEAEKDLKLLSFNGTDDKQVEIIGNGHTIKYTMKTRNIANSNYNDITNCKFASVFGELNNVKISDLNVDLTLTNKVSNDVLVAGFAITLNNSVINNLNIDFKYTANDKNITSEDFGTSTYNGIYDNSQSKNNTITNFVINISENK